MFEACNISNAKDPFGELEDDDEFRKEHVDANLPTRKDFNMNWPEETINEDIIIKDTLSKRY